jgi:hypothetical protein
MPARSPPKRDRLQKCRHRMEPIGQVASVVTNHAMVVLHTPQARSARGNIQLAQFDEIRLQPGGVKNAPHRAIRVAVRNWAAADSKNLRRHSHLTWFRAPRWTNYPNTCGILIAPLRARPSASIPSTGLVYIHPYRDLRLRLSHYLRPASDRPGTVASRRISALTRLRLTRHDLSSPPKPPHQSLRPIWQTFAKPTKLPSVKGFGLCF